MRSLQRTAQAGAWWLIALPGGAQLALLVWALSCRFSYAYDLEWMEGGLLIHALRLVNGASIYPPPSLDFVPFLYTPLYPAVLALLEPLFGLSYQLGRALSITSVVAIFAVIACATRTNSRSLRSIQPSFALLCCGLFAAAYPRFEGWFDLVRADLPMVALVVCAAALTHRALGQTGGRALRTIAVAACVAAAAFYCKQTAIIFVAALTVTLLRRPRLLGTYLFVAGTLGIGGCVWLNTSSRGWFWTYVFDIHQSHLFYRERFFAAFKEIPLAFPVPSAILCLTLALIAVLRLRGHASKGHRTLLLWSWVHGAAIFAGALGWGTQFAHRNAYIPAMATGAIACAAALSTLQTIVPQLTRLPGWLRPTLPATASVALALQLALAGWQPKEFVPTAAQRAAGKRLLAQIATLPEPIWVPFHPWYAHLAGKKTFVHRMGVIDMTTRRKPTQLPQLGRPRSDWQVAGYYDALSKKRFAAVVWNDRPVQTPFLPLAKHYRVAQTLPSNMQPRTLSGAITRPVQLWLPKK